MQIFNLGVDEVFFILLIAVVVLGPQRIVLFSRRAGRWIRSAVNNPIWHEVVATSNELRNLPMQFMAETGLKAEVDELHAEVVDMDRGVAEDLRGVSNLLPTTVEPASSEVDLFHS